MRAKTLQAVLCITTISLLLTAVSGCRKKSSNESVRTVKVATITSNVPFTYLNDDDQYDGYEIAVLREIDKLLPQYEFEFDGVDFALMPIALETGNASIAVCTLVRSEARQKKFLFPNQYTLLSPINFIVRSDQPDVNSLGDLSGKTVASVVSRYEHAMLVAWNKAHPGAEIVLREYSDASAADLFRAILRGEIDSALESPAAFALVSEKLEIQNLRLTPPVFIEDNYYMLAKGETALRDDLDGAIKALREDGTLSRLSERYLGEDVFAKYAAQFEAQGSVR